MKSPLTPALFPSEGEREIHRQAQGEWGAAGGSTTTGITQGCRRLFPLPFGRGEGQGEGILSERE